MKEIKLNTYKKSKNANLNLAALVDDEDYDYLNEWKWYVIIAPYTSYAARGSSGTVFMHRLIMNAIKGEMIDHKDRNGLNNQKTNLRLCTFSQNNANIVSRINSTSKYLGVYWCKRKMKWKATITFNRKSVGLGTFNDEVSAARAYNIAALKNHGAFANLNKI
jgi:hypothetical protein